MRLVFESVLESHVHGRATILLLKLPDDESDLLTDLPILRGGFGSIKVDATIGDTTWRTSVFPDKGVYLLLIARKLAAREVLAVGNPVTVTLTVVAA
ncbi:MAG: DUF1905 domain-containing protein [Cellulomonadaceae bacterium]|nr:DUF1905 domain-containing protein [Cellulomonadaceae bacterium]